MSGKEYFAGHSTPLHLNGLIIFQFGLRVRSKDLRLFLILSYLFAMSEDGKASVFKLFCCSSPGCLLGVM